MTDEPIHDELDAPTHGGAAEAPATAHTLRRDRLRVSIGAATVVIVAVVALVLASGSSPGSRPTAAAAATVRRAVLTTVHAGSFAFTMSLNESLSEGSVSISGTGACTIGNVVCSMSLTEVAPTGSIRMQERVVHNVTYVGVQGAAASQLPTPWISVAYNPKALPGSSTGGLGANPLSQFAALARAGASVTKLGDSTVNGTASTEYQVVVPARLAAKAAASFDHQLPAWMRQEASAVKLPSSTTEDVWLTGGRLAKLSSSVQVSAQGQTVNVSIALVVTGYHVPVHAVAPPASEVTPFSKLGSSGL